MSMINMVNKNDFVVGGKYRLMRKIGSGSFGDIYLGINVSNGEVLNFVFIIFNFIYPYMNPFILLYT